MNIVYGFGGMRSDGETLSFNPTIPEHWISYSFQVFYRGSTIRVEVLSSFRSNPGGGRTIHIDHGSGPGTESHQGRLDHFNQELTPFTWQGKSKCNGKSLK